MLFKGITMHRSHSLPKDSGHAETETAAAIIDIIPVAEG
jgi:hypothetical protein